MLTDKRKGGGCMRSRKNRRSDVCVHVCNETAQIKGVVSCNLNSKSQNTWLHARDLRTTSSDRGFRGVRRSGAWEMVRCKMTGMPSWGARAELAGRKSYSARQTSHMYGPGTRGRQPYSVRGPRRWGHEWSLSETGSLDARAEVARGEKTHSSRNGAS